MGPVRTAVILIGIPGSGKSTFYRERFGETHLRINLDMLKTRHRERLILEACLIGRQPFAVDNTNPTREARARYIRPAREYEFKVVGYYFISDVAGALERNRQRRGRGRVPDKAVVGISRKLEHPVLAEGFNELWSVRIDPRHGFVVEELSDKDQHEGRLGSGLSG